MISKWKGLRRWASIRVRCSADTLQCGLFARSRPLWDQAERLKAEADLLKSDALLWANYHNPYRLKAEGHLDESEMELKRAEEKRLSGRGMIMELQRKTMQF